MGLLLSGVLVSPLATRQGSAFLAAQGLVGGRAGGGDPDQVAGVAGQPPGLADLGDASEAALEAVTLTRHGRRRAPCGGGQGAGACLARPVNRRMRWPPP